MPSIREHARYHVIDGCPAPRKYAWAWHEIKNEVGVATLYNSIYRGDDAAGILHAHGHHTQSEVIHLFEIGEPGFGPANPVNRSSHCLYNDGLVAPHRPVGAKIPGWQCGFDVNDALIPEVERAIRALGFHGRRVYRTGSEYHHFNLTRPPVRRRKHRPKHGHVERLRIAGADRALRTEYESLADTEAELANQGRLW